MNRKLWFTGFQILLFLFLVSSCKKEEESPYSYLVSTEKATSYTTQYINTLLDNAVSYYPEISAVKPFISVGVDVYIIFYTTDIGTKKIKASGLMCVPQLSGSYPVISFQNGTNTVDAYAPSNFFVNPQYQMIEIIASMGYIVLLPDYPGFGASASVAHPYLVKEPTVRSIVDMLRAVKEAAGNEIRNIEVKNEYYFIGYSQGGWATMAMHNAMENEYGNEFNLAGSVCGAGPYDLYFLLSNMTDVTVYPMPVYICYIINAYKAYNQFTNPVTDILKEPYASKLPLLFNGKQDFGQINSQLTTSVPDLLTAEFLAGFKSDSKYEPVRNALVSNSIQAWKTMKPLYMLHGGSDTQVNPQVTEYFYSAMISAGSSTETVKKEILEGLDHGDAAAPAIIKGLLFINDIHSRLN
ncbi:MAG TPA: alpha/beta fold hydrolase [Bacteroidales bacterium]|nr:alpha/beta fold hydrolase [Bacteroidales bacterium]